MQVGQEGDLRPYRKPRKDDYYEAKSAVEELKRQSTTFPHCRVCGVECRGATFGKPPDDITCLRCWSEGVG